jgi:hypothetical protein
MALDSAMHHGNTTRFASADKALRFSKTYITMLLDDFRNGLIRREAVKHKEDRFKADLERRDREAEALLRKRQAELTQEHDRQNALKQKEAERLRQETLRMQQQFDATQGEAQQKLDAKRRESAEAERKAKAQYEAEYAETHREHLASLARMEESAAQANAAEKARFEQNAKNFWSTIGTNQSMNQPPQHEEPRARRSSHHA